MHMQATSLIDLYSVVIQHGREGELDLVKSIIAELQSTRSNFDAIPPIASVLVTVLLNALITLDGSELGSCVWMPVMTYLETL